MIDFQDFKREYINENLPKLYAGELDVDMAQLVTNMLSDECAELNTYVAAMYFGDEWRAMDLFMEKMAMDWLGEQAETEYKNMIAAAEDEAGAERAFYNLNR